MSSVRIWQSPFMTFFLSQQHLRWFRCQAASTIVFNFVVLLLIVFERRCQLCLWFFPSLVKYAAYHSYTCLAAIVLFSYNVLDFTIRYLHCCYKLNCKFVVATEEEKNDISRSFHYDVAGMLSVCGAGRTSPSRSPHSSPPPPFASSPSQQQQLLRSSPLDRIYLPSASPNKSALARQQQQLQSSFGSPVHRSSFRGSPSPPPRIASASSTSSDLSAYFSPPRNLSRLSASLLQQQQQQQLHQLQACSPDFSHLGRLRYQPGTPGRRQSLQQQQQQQLQPLPQLNHQQQQQHHGSCYQSILSHEATMAALGIDKAPMSSPQWGLRSREDLLDRWLQGIRTWLHASLIEPLSRDVERVNARLRELGAPCEMTVGSASVQQLQQSAPAAAVVGQLLPYLAACEDQGYLVRRLSELASLHCLGSYRWDSGSPGRWSDRLPNDATLLMSLLAAYLDRCLPPLPGNAKPFSSVYMAKQQQQPQLPATAACVDHWAGAAAADLRILQASRQPPHYQLVLLTKSASQQQQHQQQHQRQQILLDVAPGCRNLFHCLVFFFHWHHSRGGGRLGPLALGEGGLNLAWIFHECGGGEE